MAILPFGLRARQGIGGGPSKGWMRLNAKVVARKKKRRAPAVDVSRPQEHRGMVGVAPPATSPEGQLSKMETTQLPIAKGAIRHFVGARGWKANQLRRDVGNKVKLQVSGADAVQGMVEVSCHSDFLSQTVAKVKDAIAKAEKDGQGKKTVVAVDGGLGHNASARRSGQHATAAVVQHGKNSLSWLHVAELAHERTRVAIFPAQAVPLWPLLAVWRHQCRRGHL